MIKTREDIPAYLSEAYPCARICEVGVCKGDNLRSLLRCQPSLAVGVDLWPANRRRYYRNLCVEFLENPVVKLCKMSSKEAASIFADNEFDYVYLDACHSYEAVKQDIELWWPKVITGGILAGHDYTDEESTRSPVEYKKGVIRAVDEFRGDRKFLVTRERWPSWMVWKS